MKRARGPQKAARARRRAAQAAGKDSTFDALQWLVGASWDKLFAMYAHKTNAGTIVLTTEDALALKRVNDATPMTFAVDVQANEIHISLMTKKAYERLCAKRASAASNN